MIPTSATLLLMLWSASQTPDLSNIPDSEDQQKATLEIRFGPHRLTTPVKVEF